MNLRSKLLTVFGALAVIVLVTAGITFWVIAQWRTTNDQIEEHYQRSLILQRVRAATFRAFKEVPDAVTGDDPNSRQEFEEYIRPALDDFQRWSELAASDEEKAEVMSVRQAFDMLVATAGRTFYLIEAGRRPEAVELMEGKLEDSDFAEFDRRTNEAVASDRRFRQVIREGNARTKRTAQTVITVAAFGALSLVLLLAAYLASDLFKPLGEVEAALRHATAGDFTSRLDEERQDEFGRVNAAYNRLVARVAERERLAMVMVAATEGADGNPTQDETWDTTTSRLTLHALVAQLGARVLRLSAAVSAGNGDGSQAGDTDDARQALVAKVEELAQAVARVTEFGFPLDLNLARADIRVLLYETLLRFHEEFAQRGVSFELNIKPDVTVATLDRLKMREAVGELVTNALAALPASGGNIGLRARRSNDATELLIEVADDGKGTEESPIDNTFGDGAGETERVGAASAGLRLTKAIIEKHGGRLSFNSQPGEGTYVQIAIPLRD